MIDHLSLFTRKLRVMEKESSGAVGELRVVNPGSTRLLKKIFLRASISPSASVRAVCLIKPILDFGEGMKNGSVGNR
jgi:hypothetical protein